MLSLVLLVALPAANSVLQILSYSSIWAHDQSIYSNLNVFPYTMEDLAFEMNMNWLKVGSIMDILGSIARIMLDAFII